ncbi:MAG: hypothetical protein HY820_20910 [Acidobacteria bacterium]|nr:hypothetical protein [Acidobacteriota bacterium]
MLRAALLLIPATLPAATLHIGVFDLFRPTTLLLRAAAIAIADERLATPSELTITAAADTVICRIGSRALRGRRLSVTGPRVQLTVPGKLTRAYNGNLEITASAGVLIATVQMDIEEAVAAVVAAEMPHAPQAALEAQAIAARSYYTASKGRHSGFDFCDTTHCQALQQTTPVARRAAHSSTGQVIHYQNNPVGAMYFRSCSGRTLGAIDVKLSAEGYPYFAVDCEACRRRPHTWETRVPESSAEALVVKGPSEALRLELARIIGWNRLPSNTYTTERTPGTIIFRGKGHGHGIGMCQNGAIAMARQGLTTAQILSHYYPHTAIRR